MGILDCRLQYADRSDLVLPDLPDPDSARQGRRARRRLRRRGRFERLRNQGRRHVHEDHGGRGRGLDAPGHAAGRSYQPRSRLRPSVTSRCSRPRHPRSRLVTQLVVEDTDRIGSPSIDVHSRCRVALRQRSPAEFHRAGRAAANSRLRARKTPLNSHARLLRRLHSTFFAMPARLPCS